MTYKEICQLLCQRYGDGEAHAIARYLLEVGYGLSMSDILCGATEQLPQQELQERVGRLTAGEPVQYVVGIAEFRGRHFHVAPGVLIPRPETAELCQWIIEDQHSAPFTHHPPIGGIRGGLSLLDIGTGSGCIAITLALDIPNAMVEAWDISNEALAIAQQNAKALNANISFKEKDIIKCGLYPALEEGYQMDIIVSNPPYIVPSESAAMSETVLNHEPDIALFTPEDEPLKFYRAISGYAKTALAPHGKLYFEINPLFAQQLEALLKEQGFGDITFKDDQFGKQRFVRATLNK